MKFSLTSVITIFLSIILQTSIAQQDKQKIIAHFDFVTYYPDSTIKEAYTMVGLTVEGTLIEFDSLGEPVAIGLYKARKKEGDWKYPDGSTHYFKKGKDAGNSLPFCGTGIMLAQQEFKKRYCSLIGCDTPLK